MKPRLQEADQVVLGSELGEIAKSYSPEFVAKHYDKKSESFLFNKEGQEIRSLPKLVQHALIVLEVETMYGTGYARSINDKLRKLWDIRDEIITKKALAHDYKNIELLPDIQSELSQHLAQWDLGYYDRRREQEEGTAESKYHARRKEVIEDFIGLKAYQTLEQIQDREKYDSEDVKFLEEHSTRFLNKFYESSSESGFSVEELKNFHKKGKLITGTFNLSSSPIKDVYVYLMNQNTHERAFIIREGMLGSLDYGFAVRYCPDFTAKNDQEFSSYTKRFEGDTQEKGNKILDTIREKFS